jgi:hypothetical protein
MVTLMPTPNSPQDRKHPSSYHGSGLTQNASPSRSQTIEKWQNEPSPKPRTVSYPTRWSYDTLLRQTRFPRARIRAYS